MFEFLVHPSITISKKLLLWKFWKNFPVKSLILESLILVHLQAYYTHLPREVYVHFRLQKKACLRNFRLAKRCVCAIAYLIRQILSYLYSFFESEIYVSLNEKRKIYKRPYQISNVVNKFISLVFSFAFTLIFHCIIRSFFHCE